MKRSWRVIALNAALMTLIGFPLALGVQRLFGHELNLLRAVLTAVILGPSVAILFGRPWK